ncbi:hypothetical protein [Occallatibacter riparius]|uniref:RNA polymerase sigma factor 70 region 4 type 2 domain-containing protein n=1 Tax=Occallatibacter riparius TaxID=1002689 RepID=A0A9J7BQ82_9BACT|nr:hypothetical protein [Occallatibacter riparius]UWZ84713.1 hypothetical protein MOP44_01970 [Occallatibacter riparius]
MSAVLQFPTIALAAAAQRQWQATGTYEAHPQSEATPQSGFGPARQLPDSPSASQMPGIGEQPIGRPVPSPNLAFYRKHTERLLRRYLLASMLVARSPVVFRERIGRGRSSNRRNYTFEDSVIFVLDVEKGLEQVSALDRVLINRIVLQEYSITEAALLLNKSQRSIGLRLADALDRLTGILIENGTLKIPNRQGPMPEIDTDD